MYILIWEIWSQNAQTLTGISNALSCKFFTNLHITILLKILKTSPPLITSQYNNYSRPRYKFSFYHCTMSAHTHQLFLSC